MPIRVRTAEQVEEDEAAGRGSSPEGETTVSGGRQSPGWYEGEDTDGDGFSNSYWVDSNGKVYYEGTSEQTGGDPGAGAVYANQSSG